MFHIGGAYLNCRLVEALDVFGYDRNGRGWRLDPSSFILAMTSGRTPGHFK
jgi:hypothetical protein